MSYNWLAWYYPAAQHYWLFPYKNVIFKTIREVLAFNYKKTTRTVIYKIPLSSV